MRNGTSGASRNARPFDLIWINADPGPSSQLRAPDGCASTPRLGSVHPLFDGDGQLEILVQTFDHGVDIFTVPGSGKACTPWPTARGNLLRNGAGPSTAK
jgi:hypothetical protein